MCDKLLIRIPFAGLYCSWYDNEFDYCVEREADYLADEFGFEEYGVELDCVQWLGVLHDCTDWEGTRRAVAEKYPQWFSGVIGDLVDCAILDHLKFGSMQSPRFYNFETDKIFCWIPASVVMLLRDEVSDGTLRDRVRKNHSSYDGFISFYSNDLDEWPKDVCEWDHNQLCTLLEAWMDDYVDDSDWEFKVFEAMQEDIGNAWSANVDWSKVGECARELAEQGEE